jgi:hypothetical protein
MMAGCRVLLGLKRAGITRAIHPISANGWILDILRRNEAENHQQSAINSSATGAVIRNQASIASGFYK